MKDTLHPRETRSATAYHAGRPYPITLYRVGSIWLESATADAFDEMCNAAKSDKIELIPTYGFRSHEEQTAIWDKRACLCVPTRMRNSSHGHSNPNCPVRLKGPVARPGTSSHEAGKSVDITTGLTVASFRAGAKSPIYTWLKLNAHQFGFENDVKVEPWHWTFTGHREDRTT